MSAAPTREVLEAFGVRGTPVPLEGGRGTSWSVDGLVLKRGAEEEAQRWLGTELAAVRQVGFRLPELRRASGGRWTVDGWGATVPGTGMEAVATDGGSTPQEWASVLEAGRAFHRAACPLARPTWLAARDDWWARADAAAWDAAVPALHPAWVPLVRRLRAALAPLGEDQLVHGDLAGNVLLHPGTAPVVLDVSPYWRPAAYAEGIVMADALSWGGAPPWLPAELGVGIPAVVRGLLFRVLTSHEMHAASRHRDLPPPPVVRRELDRWNEAADAQGL